MADLSSGAAAARLGGAALIGGVAPWPLSPGGQELTLLISIPGGSVGLPGGQWVSVFSCYSATDYFLDLVTEPTGHTRVLVHPAGTEVRGGAAIPPIPWRVDSSGPAFLQDPPPYGGRFCLQIFSGDFPEPFRDALGLTDAVGYLFLTEDSGEFVIQVT